MCFNKTINKFCKREKLKFRRGWFVRFFLAGKIGAHFVFVLLLIRLNAERAGETGIDLPVEVTQ